MTGFCVFQILVAVAQNLQTIFVCRLVQALFGAAPVGTLSGLYVDMLEPIEIGVAISVFAAVVFASPEAGPIAGSFLTQSSLGWRWAAWITLIIGTIFTFTAWLVTKETFAPLILRRKARRLRHESKNWALHAESEEQPVDVRVLITRYLTKPIRMLVQEPIVSHTEPICNSVPRPTHVKLAILTAYTTFTYGLLYVIRWVEGLPELRGTWQVMSPKN